MRKKRKKVRRTSSPVALQDFCPELLKQYVKNPHQDILRQLWDNWDMVCPQEIIDLVKPYSYKGKVLYLGADNPLDLQETRMYYAELLERMNVFLEAYGLANYFERLEFSLIRGKKSLLEYKGIPKHLKNVFPPRPKRYGEKIDFHGMKSIERCYEAFCKRLDYEEKLKNTDN